MDRIAEIEQKAANGYWETDGDESVFSNTPMLEDIRYLLARAKAADALAAGVEEWASKWAVSSPLPELVKAYKAVQDAE